MKYKKILATVGSVLMLGATAAGAFAANYPAPFASEGAMVVVGANADASDMTAATNIASDLSGKIVPGASVNVEGGDSFQLERSSSKFYFDRTLDSVYTTLDADELKVGLADGVYDSADIDDVDYEQSISLGSRELSLFSDTKYKNKEPTVGFKFTNGETILKYTIDFDDNEVNFSKMKDSDLPLLGKEYFVLGANKDKIELLDSANTVILEDGAETTVNGKVVSINWIDDDKVILNVDGTNVRRLREGEFAKLSDGSYIAVKNILSSARESTTQKVEFSIGSGKIILDNGKEVIMGEDTSDKVKGLFAYIESDTDWLNGITLNWTARDTTFLTQSDPITMPGFGGISVIFNGLNYGSDSEAISLNGGSETLTLEMGNFNLPLMWYDDDGNEFLQGEEDHRLVIATNNTNVIIGNASNFSELPANTEVLQLVEDERFIVTLIRNDLADVETLYYQVANIDVDEDKILVELEDLIGSKDLKWDGTFAQRLGEKKDAGDDVEVKLEGFGGDQNETIYLSFTDGVSFNRTVSQRGLVVTIPETNTSAIIFTEANKDGDVGQGINFSARVEASKNDKVSVKFVEDDNVTKKETLTDNKYTALIHSELATKISTDESKDEYSLAIEYFGNEALADVRVSIGSTTSVVGEVGAFVTTDTETAKISGKNLIVVGGSAINSVAADLLGGAHSGEDFTAATGVGAGQFLIQSFAREGKVALLVAGYEAEDTTKAATYLVNNVVNTAVGAKEIKSTTVVADRA